MLAAIQRPGEKSAFITRMHAHTHTLVHKRMETAHMSKNLPRHGHMHTSTNIIPYKHLWNELRLKRNENVCAHFCKCIHTQLMSYQQETWFHFASMVIECDLVV